MLHSYDYVYTWQVTQGKGFRIYKPLTPQEAFLRPLKLMGIENIIGNGAFGCTEQMLHLLQ